MSSEGEQRRERKSNEKGGLTIILQLDYPTPLFNQLLKK